MGIAEGRWDCWEPVAVHRIIIVVDVEGFGDSRRILPCQLSVRRGLYGALRKAFDAIGVPWDLCYREDRGDGVLILAPGHIPKAPFVVSLPNALASAVRTHNVTHGIWERIRLRMALHAGEVAHDENGVTAAAVTLAFRLLDAHPLKDALAHSTGVLAMITSAWFFDEVVRNSPDANPTTFRPVPVVVKETATVGWIALPDQVCPDGLLRDVGPGGRFAL
jgi:hypothetical protein